MVNSIRDVQQSVTGMCEMSRVDVRPQLPALFTKFVRQLRTLDSRALQQLYTSTTPGPCEKAKYVILTDVYANRFIAVDRSVAYIVSCILSISQSMYLIQATWPVWKNNKHSKTVYERLSSFYFYQFTHTHTHIHTLPLAANFHVDLSYLVVS